MSILLFRVDERLIHGQVVVGWGTRLHPSRYLVVDDGLAESPWERELYELGLPPGVEAHFSSVTAATARLAAWRADPVPSILLTRDVVSMGRLMEGHAMKGETVNLGGIHHAPGRQEVLSYLHLDDEDIRWIRRMRAAGIQVVAQDLPGSPRRPAERLIP